MPTPNHIPHPIERDPDALVENVYAEQGTLNWPDLESQDVMSEHLMDRMDPDPGPQTRIVLAETGKTLPRFERQIVGTKEGTRWERNGWLITPKVALGLFIASLVVGNGAPAAQDTVDEGKQVGHDVYRFFYPLGTHQESEEGTRTTFMPVQHIQVDAGAENLPGSASIDEDAISRFEGKVARVIKKDGKVVSVTITGRSSDDYGSNESIGKREPADQDFADERAKTYAEALRKTQLFAGTPVITKIDQNVLTPVQKAKMQKAAEQAGFTGPNNIIDALNSVAASDQSGSRLERIVNRLFTTKRGVTLDASVKIPRQKVEVPEVTYVEVPNEDNPPENPDRDYTPWFIPPIPVPKWRRIPDSLKAIKRWRMLPGHKIFTPKILKEQDDQAWVRVRPEAKQEDGSLVENSWAYTRKYEHLLRDGRIADVLRADYTDPEGKKKALRIMFVDKSPAQETLDAFEELLKKFPSMQDGKLGDRVGGIFVYPSENTGTRHRDPKRIAMGIDKQSPEHILGTYTYILDLVELHMPSTWDAEELEELFHDFHGPRWTIAHEVGSHGTDDNDTPLMLREVRARGIPRAHIIAGDNRAKRMTPLRGILERLPRRQQDKTQSTIFNISYPVVDNQGNTVTMSANVFEHDPRLAHATHATIIGYQPTQYAGEDETEHYGETGAAVITGDEIPYSQAFVSVPQLTTDDGKSAAFAKGYRPDIRGQRLFTDAVGAEPGSYPISFANPTPVTISHVAPANDPLIREHLIRTRRLRSLQPHEMEAILARVSARKRPEES